jgi:hypothetical protein
MVGINSPGEGQYIHGMYTFQAIAMDDVGVSQVMITVTNTDTTTVVIDNVPMGYNSASGHYELSLDTMILVDGNYEVSCMAYDMAGHSSTATTVAFMIDNTAPVLTITSPHDGDLLTGTVSIEVVAEDTFLSGVMYNVDDAGWVDIDVDWDTSALADGAHTVMVKAMDEPGHYVMQTIEVTTDNTEPGLYAVMVPENDEHVGASFFVSVDAMDMVGLEMVTYHFGNLSTVMMFVNKETGFYEADITTTHLEDGDNKLYITATDSAGFSTQIERNIFVDNSGPVIEFVEPKDGDTVDADWKFIVTITDDTEIESVFIRIDKEDWLEMKEKDGQYMYTWNTRLVYNGKYDIDVKAVDTLGNEAEESITVEVDNFPLLGFIIFIIGLVLFLTLMVVSWVRGSKPKKEKKKKKKKGEPETSFEDLEPEQPQEMTEEVEVDMGGGEEGIPDDLGYLPPPKSEEEL